jgi:hypothetical protein
LNEAQQRAPYGARPHEVRSAESDERSESS